MTSPIREDINDVLDDVIVKINRITDHLRLAGENEAANEFTKEMTATFKKLYNVIAPWSMQECLMQPVARACAARSLPPIDRTIATPSPLGGTWAAVAATEAVRDKNGIIKYGPNDGVKRTIALDTVQNGHDSRDRRVVWINPWSADRPLAEVSKQMTGIGAVYSIAFVPDEQAVCIIFQHAHCAVDFLHDCAEHVGRTGISPFGSEYNIFPGVPYPMDDGLRLMDNPCNARRRLTFARSQLFSNGVSENRFREDIVSLVGATNVELLWLFNTGNATVVFSAVPLAKLVKDKFYQYSRIPKHPYEGIKVSYSHDPCERDMHLVSQIPGRLNYIGTNGSSNRDGHGTRTMRSSTLSSTTSRRHSTTSSDHYATVKRRKETGKAKIDEEGWQTVLKKRR